MLLLEGHNRPKTNWADELAKPAESRLERVGKAENAPEIG
jgi:hypothetical protein